MAYQLDATAEYIKDGNTIIAEAFVYDSDAEVFHPELVTSGLARIQSGEVAIARPISFDRRFGNEEGGFKFSVTQPLRSQGVTFFVTTTLVDGTILERTVPLQIAGEAFIPLTEQPDNAGNEDMRSKDRIDEGL